jgi:hypothetical protein
MVARVVGLESMNRTPSLTQQDEGKGAGQVLLLYRHCDLKNQRLKKPSLGGSYFSPGKTALTEQQSNFVANAEKNLAWSPKMSIWAGFLRQILIGRSRQQVQIEPVGVIAGIPTVREFDHQR